MKIRLLFFAAVRDAMKRSEDTYSLVSGDTPASVARKVLGFDSLLLFAVNDELMPADYQLGDGDTLAFIPPMAGG